MSDVIWGIDVSAWQSYGDDIPNGWYKSQLDRFPLQAMRDNGCRFAIVKASMQLSKDKTAADHVRLLRDAGFDIGVYHWCDPIDNYSKQSGLFLEQIEDLDPAIVAFDVEQYWASWNDKTKILTEKQIIDNYHYVFDFIRRAGELRKSLEYTANWFVQSFIEPLHTGLGLTDLWVAQYTMWRQYIVNNFPGFKWNDSRWMLSSWEQFHRTLDHINAHWKAWHDGSTFQRTLYPRGYKDHKVFQVDSKTGLPGAPYNIDLNIFNGNEADYLQWLDKATPPPPPPPPENLEERLVVVETGLAVVEDKLIKIKQVL